MRAHTKLAPQDGWQNYTMNEALLDYATDLFVARGWHRLSPVRNTLIVEAPNSGGSLYLGLEEAEDKISDAVLYPPEEPDSEFERLAHDLSARFHIHATNVA